jgi:hypothetical protein
MLTTVNLFSDNDCCIKDKCPKCKAPIVGTNPRVEFWVLIEFKYVLNEAFP